MAVHRRKCAFFGVVCLVATLLFEVAPVLGKPPAPPSPYNTRSTRFNVRLIGSSRAGTGRSGTGTDVGLQFIAKGEEVNHEPVTSNWEYGFSFGGYTEEVFDHTTDPSNATRMGLPIIFQVKDFTVKITGMKYNEQDIPEARGVTLSVNNGAGNVRQVISSTSCRFEVILDMKMHTAPLTIKRI